MVFGQPMNSTEALATATNDAEIDQFWEAAMDGQIAVMQDLKGKGANPSWFNPWDPPGRAYQFAPLHVAAGGGHIDVVKYLVEKCQVEITAKAVVIFCRSSPVVVSSLMPPPTRAHSLARRRSSTRRGVTVAARARYDRACH